MDRAATKTHYERQKEEDERLVRPNPPEKPARHDLRREQTKPEQDPDLDDASDRKDRSKNYKVTATDERIPAKNRETGETVHIAPDTLKEQPGKYEPIDKDEEEKKPEEPEEEGAPKKKKKGPKSDEPPASLEIQQAGEDLRAQAEGNPKLQAKFQALLKPGSEMDLMAQGDVPIERLFPDLKVPEIVTNLKQLQTALRTKAKAKPKEQKSKPPEAPPAEAPDEAPSSEKPAEGAPAEAPAEKPKKKEKAPEKAREPTEAEKAGIGEPKRRPVTSADRQEALSLLAHTFPPEVAADVIAKNMHPDDVKTLVRDYNSAKLGVKVKDPADLAAKAASFYQPDPTKVKPPLVGKNAAGEKVSFDKLTPDEKAEATRAHQLRVAAMSLAAQDLLTEKLTDKGLLTGKPSIPPVLASQAAKLMLQSTPPEQADQLAAQTFDATLKSGSNVKIGDGAARRFLDQIKRNPVALASAKSYMQANDYGLAKQRYLKGDDESISEWQHSGAIVRGLRKIGEFFDKRNELYGGDPEHPAAQMFRMRVLGRLRTLDPEKAAEVTKALPKLEDEEYAKHHKHWAKTYKEWEAKKAKHDAALEAYHADPEGKKPPGEFTEPEPHEPKPPAGRPDPSEGESMWEEVGAPPEETGLPPKKKEASDFTYLSTLVMGTSAVKKAVYHGVDPYAYGPAAYPGWLQPHQRDLGESDFESIISSANDWLASPLLTLAMDGLVPDARYRAALDLSIYAGPYNGQIQPNIYNRLLAKLAQMPEPGMGETLETIREKKARSSYKTACMSLEIPGFTPAAKETLHKARFPYRDEEGLVRAGGNAAVRGVQGSTVTVDLPKGSETAALVAIRAALEPLKLTVEKSRVSTDTSTFTPTTSDPTGGSTSMKASQELYRIAGSLAETNSKASFDILALADRLADDEKKMPPWLEKKIEDKDEKKEASSGKYATLRSTIIKQASATPAEQRGPLLPILQAIKDLG